MRVPSLTTRGKFTLKNPFVAKESVVYHVLAIRDFADLYIKGADVYTQFYKTVGLVNGVKINGGEFYFDKEALLKPKIITLKGSDDSIIYVPTTYITSFPTASDILYSRIILSADLGALPDSVSVDSILDDVQELISARFGVVAKVDINRSHSTRQPTNEEHDILEESRMGGISSNDNNYSEVTKYKEKLAQANAKIQVMTKILVENNLI